MSAEPQIDRGEWQRIEGLLDEVLELPAQEAGAFLDRACAGEPDLRARVEKLLALDRRAGSFLGASAMEVAADLLEETSEEEEPLDPSAGKLLGPYRLIRRIGAGGMGEVYLARDSRLDRQVAVKLLPPEWSRDAAARERFALEARAASALDHPNICTVHDVGESEEGRLFLVMTYYPGETLERRLQRGPLPVAEALDLAIQVGRGLSRAHEAGIVHRDVKPANVVVTRRGEAKILDFGLAKIAGSIGLTRTGLSLGTPAYMAPEQARGDAVDARADVWSLGVMLYEMIAGRRPFGGDHPQAVIHSILSRDPEPLARHRQGVPEALERAVARSLAKAPADRHATMSELLADLEAAAAGSPAHGPAGAASLSRPSPEATSAASEPPAAAAATPVIRVLVLADLVDSTRWVATLGDRRAFELAVKCDRVARDLLSRGGGTEIDKSDGFLLLFERAADAVGWALAYHQALARLSQEESVELTARVGIHLGEVLLRRNPGSDVARGAKPLEVEGLAKPTAARVAALARGRQTLLTRAAFDLARRAAVGGDLADPELAWLAHGTYVLAGVEEPLEVFEVGVRGFAPLVEPAGSEKARRVVAIGDELTLGWRPAPGQPIPRRPNWALAGRIGEGGFGEVWLAEHKSGERRVFKFCFEAARLRALKREVTLFRLLKEGLGHRHDIARVLDWNFDHAPYFLESEYTEGGSLVEWAGAHGGLAAIPLEARLELAAEVAEALAAAHSVGILHKDVKPGNVLVAADHEGRPRARLTDFGIGLLTDAARLSAQGITALGFTSTAAEPSGGGTVRYLAPELLEGKPASIQADVYSLGVMVYQLVVGDFSRALASGWRREVEDELLAEDLAAFVDGRPERRPASALVVAEKLRTLAPRRAAREAERRARQEAEAARRGLERAQRRRKAATAVAATAVVVLALVASLALSERRARQTAALRQRQAEDLIGFMLGDLRRKLEPVGRLEILDEVGAKAMEYFESLPAGEESDEERLRRARALSQIGEVRMAQGDLEAALALFRQSLTLSRQLVGRDPRRPNWQAGLAAAHFWVGSVLWTRGDLEGALAENQAYLSIAEGLVREEPGNPAWQLELAYALTNLGAIHEARGDMASALPAIERSIAIKERLVGLDPTDRARRRSLANGLSWLASTLQKVGDLPAALARYRSELAARRALAAEDPGDADSQHLLAISHGHVAELLVLAGEAGEALAEAEAAVALLAGLAAQDPANRDWQRELAVHRRKLAEALLAEGDSRRAGAELETARATFEALVASDSSNTDWRRELIEVRLAEAAAALASGRPQVALAAAEAALAVAEPRVREAAGGAEDRRLSSLASGLEGEALAGLDRPERARAAWSRALELIEPAARGSRDGRLLDAWARALLHLGRPEAGALVGRLKAEGYAPQGLVELCAGTAVCSPAPRE